jgi:hypothetical protein
MRVKDFLILSDGNLYFTCCPTPFFGLQPFLHKSQGEIYIHFNTFANQVTGEG